RVIVGDDDWRWASSNGGVRHAERAQDTLGCEVPKRLSADPRHNAREDVVAAVVVAESGAGCEVDALLPGKRAQDVGVDVDAGRSRRLEFDEEKDIPQAGRVREKMSDRDPVPPVRPLRYIPPHLIVDRQLP